MRVLGISPLDKDATASLVEDGRVLFAAAEERFSRVKLHAGFPQRAIEATLEATGVDPAEIDVVAYPFLSWDAETELIERALADERVFERGFQQPDVRRLLEAAEGRVPARTRPVSGLQSPNQTMAKGPPTALFDRLAGVSPLFATIVAHRASKSWGRRASKDHRAWQRELETGLSRFGLLPKLQRAEHHLSHAANAYLASGLERALIVTLDGYGSGLAGSIGVGREGDVRRLHAFTFPHSLGNFYQLSAGALGFNARRDLGKVVGLAAYGDPRVLSDVLLARFEQTPGDYKILHNLNEFFAHHLAARFPMVDLAAAWQHVLEVVVCNVVRHWVKTVGCGDVVLSGGVAANVKMNQRVHEVDGVSSVFIYPNMGDGGCGTGLALLWSWSGAGGEPLRDVYLGPSYTDAEIRSELDRAGLPYGKPRDMPADVAGRVHAGEVIGRFDGRMEYGPRALGNRSILCQAGAADVNQWLNERLGRREFMPFAPVTLWEARERCYLNTRGAEHAAQFMTITFDCTDWMKESCPAAVHVDGTARPQLIRREINPDYYDIVKEYERLSGIPCLINTSFNMHEEPIVCSPRDAVQAFLRARLDGLAIGPYFVPHPARIGTDGAGRAVGREASPAPERETV